MLLGRNDDHTALLGPDHHFVLERRAAQALTVQDFITALKYADRRCRIDPPPAAYCFVLRAEAAWRLGRRDAALDDLAEALSIDPSDIGANRRMLSWAEGNDRRAAAERLIAADDDPSLVRSAIAVLNEMGERHWAAVSVFDNHVAGWVAWRGEAHIEASLSCNNASLTSLLDPDPFHPLASRAIQATNFRLRRPPSANSQRLTLRCSGAIVLVRRLPPNLGSLRFFQHAENTSHKRARVPPTVVVPVYRDREATVACLESLLKAAPAQLQATNETWQRSFRVLAVDDASPDPMLGTYLAHLAKERRIDLLVNPVNLGFVGAVNRALAELSQGDVILLNADTVVPPGFVERLAEAAHSATDIGTVTPLSNSGDIFSFPKPGVDNPMPSYAEVIALDQAAATANATTVVDAPSGIGFCLYITRNCLNAIGGLSESYERGYLEDVDFCLRARDRGFRNVCAASVYVGHHGSKSFQHEKRGLVLRNLGVLDQRFPAYRKECSAFAASDPLRSVRANMEQALPIALHSSVLIAAAAGAGLAIAQTRARQLIAEGERAILVVRDQGDLRLEAFDGGAPQATILELNSEQGNASAAEWLARLRPSRLEITDPAISPALFELARYLDLPTELWITTERSLSEGDATTRVLAPTEAAAAFARAKLPNTEIVVRRWPVQPLFLPEPVSTGVKTLKTLAIVPGSPSPLAWRIIRSLAVRFQQMEHRVPIVVAGGTCEDRRLMSFPNLFVTGKLEPDELADVLTPYDPTWLLTDFDQPLFGHPLIEAARRANRPVAFRDWTGGVLGSREDDLAIAPELDDDELTEVVARWIAKP
jgi:GT2 family glycosyltransferase